VEDGVEILVLCSELHGGSRREQDRKLSVDGLVRDDFPFIHEVQGQFLREGGTVVIFLGEVGD